MTSKRFSSITICWPFCHRSCSTNSAICMYSMWVQTDWPDCHKNWYNTVRWHVWFSRIIYSPTIHCPNASNRKRRARWKSSIWAAICWHNFPKTYWNWPDCDICIWVRIKSNHCPKIYGDYKSKSLNYVPRPSPFSPIFFFCYFLCLFLCHAPRSTAIDTQTTRERSVCVWNCLFFLLDFAMFVQ